jgi:predicted nucleic acid-binding protein
MLLDTDILVDLTRKHPPADAWIRSLTVLPDITGFAAMELLNGCQNIADRTRAVRLIRPFRIKWPSEPMLERALREFSKYRLSHGLGILDALIAATALSCGQPLATFNTRHYQAVTGLVLIQPYLR